MYSGDARSSGGQAPVIFSDNSLIFGLGLRAHPFTGFAVSVQEGLAVDLILPKLRSEIGLPRLTVFAVEEDHARNDSLVHYLMLDVSPGLSLLNTGDPVISEYVSKRLEQIDLSVVAKFVGSLVC